MAGKLSAAFDYERQHATLLDEEVAPKGSAQLAQGEYESTRALSQSGMKDLAISPLRYWYLHINPEAPTKEETPFLVFGRALHCLVFEGQGKFDSQFAYELDQDLLPDLLVTIDDMRTWLRNRGCTPRGTLKADVISQVLAIDATASIWDRIKAEHETLHAGKWRIRVEEWDRLIGCADALRNEPKIREILAEGEPEIALLGEDPASGTPLKGRLDWLSPKYILDLKTFTQKRGKSIDQSVADAIYYEAYYRQAYLYVTLRKRSAPTEKPPRYITAFVESEKPHEVRLKELRPTTHGTANVYWQRAHVEVQHFCNVWAAHMREFGEKPWRHDREIEVLDDMEMKGMAY